MTIHPVRTSILALFCTVAASACGATEGGTGPTAQTDAIGSESAALAIPHLDLSAPADNLEAWIKTRASLDPSEEVVFYFTGAVYSNVKEESLPVRKTNKTLFKIEGFNIARAVPTADGYQLLSREAMFYADPVSGVILDCWNNPLNGKAVPVVPVWNDPVNFNFVASTWKPLATSSFGLSVVISSDVPLAYPSPLPVAQYPSYSASNLYQGFELFNYFTNRIALGASVKSAPADISWTRIGEYLPWMQMGQEPGGLVCQARGTKLRGGFDALPQALRDRVLAENPSYQHAPESWPAGQRNETSWSYFKKIVASGQYSPTCQ